MLRMLYRWTKNFKLFEMRYIFIPVHEPDHWTLIVINIALKTIIYFDSLVHDVAKSVQWTNP